jgi:hypothetical protein
LTLLGIMGRDFMQREEPIPDYDDVALAEPEIDKDPRVILMYQSLQPLSFKFGLLAKDSQGKTKKLTYMETPKDGKDLVHTSYPSVLVDGKSHRPGRWPVQSGRWLPERLTEAPQDLAKDSRGEHEGKRLAWLFNKPRVRFTQTTEIVAGQPDPVTYKRMLDTCLIQFTVKNEDSVPHKIGLRFLLDTYIGTNDGVPFYVPRKDRPLIDTMEEFPSAGNPTLPDYIQALETGKLDDKASTVARVGLKVGGGLEQPTHVSLTHYYEFRCGLRGDPKDGDWEDDVYKIPMMTIKGDPSNASDVLKVPDSMVVLYWDEKELKPGEERKMGFTYGLGQLASAEGGKFAISVPTKVYATDDFSVTALVSDPIAGQTVELSLPKGVELVAGSARQEVPPVPAGAASTNSSVTWQVRAPKAGTFRLTVRSSTDAKPKTLIVRVIPKSSFE